MNEIILLVNFHGVGARQIGMQYMMVKTDAVIPKPAKQVQTAGGANKLKHEAAALNPAVANPPAAPKQAAQAIGPALTWVNVESIIKQIRRMAVDLLDI